MVTIEQWFDTKDYDTGYLLLCRYSKNRVLLQNLGKKKNPGKLEYELTKYVKVQSSKFKIQSKPLPPISPPSSLNESLPRDIGGSALDAAGKGVVTYPDTPAQVVVTTDYPDSLPPHLKAKWHFNQDSYKEIRALHEKLKLMEKATPEDRQPLTERIASLDDKIRANWEEIDGYTPGQQPEASSQPPVIDHKRINANRKYISVNLKRLQETENVEKQIKIRAEVQTRYDEIKNCGEAFSSAIIKLLADAGVNI